LGDPGPGRRYSEGNPEEKVGRVGETFGQGIEKNNRERDRPEKGRRPIDGSARSKKSKRTDHQKRADYRFSQEPLSRCGARVSSVERPIGQAIEEHRGGAGQDHASQHEKQCPRGRVTVGCDQQRPECERESKNRM
jgi:hypothetical protein